MRAIFLMYYGVQAPTLPHFIGCATMPILILNGCTVECNFTQAAKAPMYPMPAWCGTYLTQLAASQLKIHKNRVKIKFFFGQN